MTKKEITKLDDLFREYIRQRDNMTCQKCGRTQNLQVAHFKSRSNKHVRWCRDNAALLCGGCHLFWAHKDPLAFSEWVINRLGETKYNFLLLASRQAHKLFFNDIKSVILNYRREL